MRDWTPGGQPARDADRYQAAHERRCWQEEERRAAEIEGEHEHDPSQSDGVPLGYDPGVLLRTARMYGWTP